MSREELEATFEDVFKGGIIVSQEEVIYFEEAAQFLLCFEHRVGRITASRFHAVKFASLDLPSASLLKQFMEKKSLNYVSAIKWRIDHEEGARKVNLELANENHANLQLTITELSHVLALGCSGTDMTFTNQLNSRPSIFVMTARRVFLEKPSTLLIGLYKIWKYTVTNYTMKHCSVHNKLC